jgi:hypothetical protein
MTFEVLPNMVNATFDLDGTHSRRNCNIQESVAHTSSALERPSGRAAFNPAD